MGDIVDKHGVPGGIRTHDPLLRRQPLYPLSYRDVPLHKNCSMNFGKGQRRGNYPEFVANQKTFQPSIQAAVTTHPAMITPMRIDVKAYLKL